MPLAPRLLTAPVSYDSGQLVFTPAAGTAASQAPPVTAAAAYAAYLATGVEVDVSRQVPAQPVLGLFTDYTAGPKNQLVWQITFPGVLDAGNGPAHVQGEANVVRPPVRQNLVAIVDATTGNCLRVLTDRPDTITQLHPTQNTAPAKPTTTRR